MTKERYEEIKNKEESMSTISRLNYLVSLGKEMEEYFDYKRYVQFQKEWVGIL